MVFRILPWDLARNLRDKRIVAFWRYRLVDCDNAFVRPSGNQKRTKVDIVEGSIGCDKAFPHPIRNKRKRERAIEDDHLHAYRTPQRRGVIDLSLLVLIFVLQVYGVFGVAGVGIVVVFSVN
ncbi:hypothetical protein RHMOL_Rhmol05G0324000 [Rhododendron molle]|uniref:Uncharacterized protein n=1 Tax=Rhododendron molle TaxID=49168 RepID=A0ACC0NV62_RHOML|nr:hypothetical protein RHMOL_Rhmol05G0324000 [Rhododendron molle]